jgi:hypothetical protein
VRSGKVGQRSSTRAICQPGSWSFVPQGELLCLEMYF